MDMGETCGCGDGFTRYWDKTEIGLCREKVQTCI